MFNINIVYRYFSNFANSFAYCEFQLTPPDSHGNIAEKILKPASKILLLIIHQWRKTLIAVSKTRIIAILSTCVILFPGMLLAGTLELSEDTKTLNAGTQVRYLEDPSGKLTINDIRSREYSEKFTESESDTPNFGYTNSAYWITFDIKNTSNKTELWFLELAYGMIDFVDLYSIDTNGGFTETKTGQRLPFNTREIKNRYFVFDLNIPAGVSKTIYMRLQNDGNIAIPLTLYDFESFYEQDHLNQILFGIYYGLMIIMLLYNLMLFIFIRDRNYLYYSFFIGVWILNQFISNGYSYEYLWPNATWWETRSILSVSGLINISAWVFSLSFLSIRKEMPRLFYFVLFLMALGVYQIIAPLITINAVIGQANDIIMLLCVLAAIAAGSISMVKGNKAARFYLIAWIAFFLGTILSILHVAGVIPHNPFTKYSMQIGSALIVVLFSIALADRYRILRVEKEITEEINRRQTDFFTNVSHEIKTPLTLISNYLDSYIESHGKAKELSIIKGNIDKLLADMVNFFDNLKFERGIDMYDHGSIIDFSEVLSQKIDLYKSMAHRSGITIHADIEESLYLKADPAAMERIINNLMDNALRYNRENGSVEVSLQSSENNILFYVRDTGIGIDEREIDHIFEPYYQITHEKRNIQGIGMGLSLVKNIINSLTGDISVESEPGSGTVFTITMKKYNLKDGDTVFREQLSVRHIDTLPQFDEDSKHAPVTGGNETVLVVEDNRDLLHLILERLGERFTVYGAVNGTEALELLDTIQPPDVIISDIMMDEMDGYELFDALDDNENFRDIPFIFVTARSQSHDRIEGLNRGAIDYIYKPFVVEELISKIDAVIRYRNLQKSLHEKDKFTSLGMLLGGISHEIFNPLSGITGPLTNLEKMIEKSDLKNNSKIQKYVGHIRSSVEKIESAVNNIRVLYSSKNIEKETVPVREIASEVVSFYGRELDGIKINLDIDQNLTVSTNRDALFRILSNLVSNSIDALDGSGTVTLSAGEENGSTVFRVTDTGRGIPPDQIDTIFNAFYTTKEVGQGVGLGLNIVKNLCMKQGWDIAVESVPDKGTTFIITVK